MEVPASRSCNKDPFHGLTSIRTAHILLPGRKERLCGLSPLGVTTNTEAQLLKRASTCCGL
jgi:hypothetical protein